MSITLNTERRLFVIGAGRGFSCLGFDVVLKRLKVFAERLGESVVGPVLESDKGTLKQYEQYSRAVAAHAQSGDTRTWFSFDTPKKVRDILERCRKEHTLVRVFYGDRETGRDWLEEFDTIGRIGRSTGSMKVPLLVPEGEHGGPAILDDCVVKIMDAQTGRVLYRHPQYHQPEFEIRTLDTPIKAGRNRALTHGVWGDGVNHANFPSYAKAAAWIGFMSGETCRPF